MSGPHDDTARPGHGRPPPGWYPDPSGAPSWRRWEGAAWGDATMPWGPDAPTPASAVREGLAWRMLRMVAPWALGAQAVGAGLLASETSTYGALRRWLRAAWQADVHRQSLPAIPTGSVGSSSPLASLAHLAVLAATVLGIIGWLRYSAASMRVAAEARYPQHHRAVTSGVLFFVPFLGPLVALAASRASLPAGHEARGALGIGWGLVLAGEVGWLALYATVLSTPAAVGAWVAAAACAAAWLAAAAVLPGALQAIAEDHASLGVRLRPAYS